MGISALCRGWGERLRRNPLFALQISRIIVQAPSVPQNQLTLRYGDYPETSYQEFCRQEAFQVHKLNGGAMMQKGPLAAGV